MYEVHELIRSLQSAHFIGVASCCKKKAQKACIISIYRLQKYVPFLTAQSKVADFGLGLLLHN
jgi:hypothetical protein